MYNSLNEQLGRHNIKKLIKCILHLARHWKLCWTMRVVVFFFSCRVNNRNKGKGSVGQCRESMVSADVFLKENAPDFPLKEIEERQHESRLHLVCICLPTVAPVEV